MDDVYWLQWKLIAHEAKGFKLGLQIYDHMEKEAWNILILFRCKATYEQNPLWLILTSLKHCKRKNKMGKAN